MLTSVHPPLDVRIFYKECRTLAEAGYNVTLIAPCERSTTSNGVRIVSIPLAKNRFLRMTWGVWRTYRLARQQNATVYHFHDPELIPIGMLLKMGRRKVVYDVHEDVPRDILVKEWLSPIFRRVLAWGASLAHIVSSWLFDAIVAATPTIATRFPGKKVVRIQNFPLMEEVDDRRVTVYADRPYYVTYVGGISRQRGAREMVKALSLLSDVSDARLVLAGQFEDVDLECELRQIPGYQKVDYRGWLSRDAVGSLLKTSRIGLVLFHPFQNYIEAQPNKLFEYMAAGLPVVASDFPVWRAIVNDVGCGLLVNPLKPEDIARAMQWLFCRPDRAEEMGRRGLAAVRTKYNWKHESRKLLELYRCLTDGRESSAITTQLG
jgi:glycosyltransferase involved in cell wall biosynthesis